MAAPTLGGTTLAYPATYNYSRGYRGGRRIMSDGSLVTDLVDTTVKHEFRMTWKLLTSTQLTAIQTAWAAIDDSSGTFVDINSNSYTVTQPQNMPNLLIEEVNTALGYRYNVEMRLRED